MSDQLAASVKAKLDAINAKKAGNKKNHLWKPPTGTSVVRIIPYRHASDPLIELHFHFDMNTSFPILCPAKSIGGDNRCPICEFAQSLLTSKTGKKGKDSPEWLLFRKIQAQQRAHAPIVVRGQEKEGFKFWGVSYGIYTSLVTLFNDKSYGDLSNELTGRDLIVDRSAPDKQFIYGKVSFRPDGDRSKLSDDVAWVKQLVASVPPILDEFTILSYNQLDDILKKFMSVTTSGKNEEGHSEETNENDVDDEVSTKSSAAPDLSQINDLLKDLSIKGKK